MGYEEEIGFSNVYRPVFRRLFSRLSRVFFDGEEFCMEKRRIPAVLSGARVPRALLPQYRVGSVARVVSDPAGRLHSRAGGGYFNDICELWIGGSAHAS